MMPCEAWLLAIPTRAHKLSQFDPTHTALLQAKFSTRTWWGSGLEMLLLGGVCALVAYELGNLVSQLVGTAEGGTV